MLKIKFTGKKVFSQLTEMMFISNGVPLKKLEEYSYFARNVSGKKQICD